MSDVADQQFCLVLANGSRAGLRAELQQGFYLIGRDSECQIRPKSRSVSRRHCLLHVEPDRLAVLDLRSTSGTRLGLEKLEPVVWVPIDAGDQIRCGKIAFDVASQPITAHPPAAVDTPAVPVMDESPSDDDEFPTVAEDGWVESTVVEMFEPPSRADVATAPGSGAAVASKPMLRGAAWQEVDIAAFLQAADDDDRQVRYDTIRSVEAQRRADQDGRGGRRNAAGRRRTATPPVSSRPTASGLRCETHPQNCQANRLGPSEAHWIGGAADAGGGGGGVSRRSVYPRPGADDRSRHRVKPPAAIPLAAHRCGFGRSIVAAMAGHRDR